MMPISINQISVQQIEEILSFIAPYEFECVNLAHEILHGAENCYIVQSDNAICGAFCFRARRTIFHCLPFTKYKIQQDKILCQETQAAFYDFFANEKPFCINGESTGSLFLKNILKNKSPSIAAKVVNDYFLLARSCSQGEGGRGKGTVTGSSSRQQDVVSMPCGLGTPTGLFNITVFRATPQDAEKLFPLEKAYQYEEVIPSNFNISDEMLRTALKLNLQNQKIFVCQATVAGNGQQCAVPSTPNGCSTFVAKAAVTAEGKNFALIGGVYTLPEHRRRGYAKILMRYILQELSAASTPDGSRTPAPSMPVSSCQQVEVCSTPCGLGTPSCPLNTALYVKKKNAAALTLYKSLGFEQVAEYKIIYF